MDFEELICNLCHHYYDNTDRLPRMVPSCGHTFCSKCITDIIRKTSTNSEQLFCCPEDRHTTRLKSYDITAFPKNFPLVRLVGKRANLSTHRVPKSASKEDLVPIIKRRNSSHSGSIVEKREREHVANSSRTQIFTAENGEANLCPEHERVFEIICMEDKCRICSNCALFGSHKNHEIRPEGDVLREIATRVENIIDIFQTIQKQEKTILDEDQVGCLNRRLKERQDELSGMIQDKFKEYINMLRVQEKNLLEDLNHRFGVVREKVQAEKQISSDLQDRIKRWKSSAEGALTIMSEKSEKGEIAFELLGTPQTVKNDILIVGEKLAFELKKTKDTPCRAFEEEGSKISVTFNDNFSKILDLLCQIKGTTDTEATFVPSNSPLDTPERTASRRCHLPARGDKSVENKSSLRNQRLGTKRQVSSQISGVKRPIEELAITTSRDKENNVSAQGSRLITPKTKFTGTTNEHRKKSEEDDLLNFDLKDITLAEITEPDQPVGSLKLHGIQDSDRERFASYRRREKESEDQDALGNLTNRNIGSKIQTERKLLTSAKGEEAYNSLSKDISRNTRISVSPVRRDNSCEQSSRQNKLKKRLDFQVPEKYEAIVEGIKNNTLDNADLTSAELGDQGVHMLAEYLKNNTRLKSLKLLKNKISDDGALALVNALFYNKTLNTLNLTQNYLTEKTLDAFMELLKAQSNIKTVYFNQNSISIRNVKTKVKEMTNMGASISI